MRNKSCRQCGAKLIKSQKKFCSNRCQGLSLRGTGKSHIRIRKNGERVYLHREIFEANVRKLAPGEIVHHKNENKHDNRIENLEALPGADAHLKKHNYWRHRRAARCEAPAISSAEIEKDYQRKVDEYGELAFAF